MRVLRTSVYTFSVVIGAALYSAPAAADNMLSDTSSDKWRHALALYMVGASIDGTVGIGPVEEKVGVDFSDILEKLEAGAMFSYRGEKGPWSVVIDFMYLALENKDKAGPGGNTDIKLNADQYTVELDAGYKITERLNGYGGLRYWKLQSRLSLDPPMLPTVNFKDTEDWVDPVIGLRYFVPFNDRWQLVARGDIGGFGVGSDFSWHVTTFLNWQFSRSFSAMAGVRFIGVDYDKGSGQNRFVWDVTMGGPAAGITWQF